MPGSRPGERRGGRKKGTPNKQTAEIRARAAAAIAGTPITPLEYMLAIMGDQYADQRRRDDMAKAAAPYVHPRKADHGEDRGNNTTIIFGAVSDADRIAAIQQLIGRAQKK